MASRILFFLGWASVIWLVAPWAVRALIRWRLKGYKVPANAPDASKPETFGKPVKVTVIGGGLAGVSAAHALATRGFDVTLREANTYLGGKLGSWRHAMKDGSHEWVSHGFHAFFRHYFNLSAWLHQLGLMKNFKETADYTVFTKDGEALSFARLDATPVLNLIALARAGVFAPGEVLKAPARDVFGIFLEYEEESTFRKYDQYSFADFDRIAQLPRKLKLAFTAFARAFFSDEDKLSLAQLVKSFHFYYLSHDHGLLYDHPTKDYEASLWSPIRDELQKHKVKLELGKPVTQLKKTSSGFTVDGAACDAVVLACDIQGAKKVFDGSDGCGPAKEKIAKTKTGQRYAVLRIWTDKNVREGLPVFISTERLQILDSVSQYHHTEDESAEWVKRHGGAVLELHCYALPDDVPDAKVRDTLIDEAQKLFPELAGLKVIDEHLRIAADFTAFHVGIEKDRPTTDSGVDGLFFAGDWVKLPFPSMLLEAAFTSGVVAANRLCAQHGVREFPLFSVPHKGLLVGTPAPPARAKVLPPKP